MAKSSYWLDVPVLTGDRQAPTTGGLMIIGAGLAGVSVAYWLTEMGMRNITIVDDQPEEAASFRNCGHILHGTVESMAALVALHGEQAAQDIWAFSVAVCQEVGDTVSRLNLDCEYRQDGYLVMAIDAAEEREIQASVTLLNRMGFANRYIDATALGRMGFRGVYGGRFEPGSAQAHPTKFRNGLLEVCRRRGVNYHSGWRVKEVRGDGAGARVDFAAGGSWRGDAAVIAANAYSKLLSSFYADHHLVEPFRGQIIASEVLPAGSIPVSYPHSFDHGYEYALRTADNRLMLGGWRNNTPKGEIGTYDQTPNESVEEGLKAFAARHYQGLDQVAWPYSWSGIMATSKTGLPFIGPTDSPVVFTCGGFTGHGFSWAHGSAKLLAQIIMGHPLPAVAPFFNPVVL